MKPPKYKLYASSSAFMWGRTVYTDYDSGCLRKILINSRGIRPPIAQTHSTLGAMNEDAYAKDLEKQGVSFRREESIGSPIDGFDDVELRGRCDFLLDSGDSVAVHELKGSRSKNKMYAVKNNGPVKENLAQLVAYMIEYRTTTGRLVYTFYNDKDEVLRTVDYDVTIDRWGRISLNGTPTQFTVYDQLAHRNAAAKVMTEGIVWDRPHNWDILWGSPCGYCPFAPSCARWDAGDVDTLDAFLDDIRKELSNALPPAPTVD